MQHKLSKQRQQKSAREKGEGEKKNKGEDERRLIEDKGSSFINISFPTCMRFTMFLDCNYLGMSIDWWFSACGLNIE